MTQPIAQTDNSPALAARREWWCTFGHGHTHPETGENLLGAYVRIRGTMAEARAAMVAGFGQQWSMQYPSAADAGVEQFGLREIPLPDQPLFDPAGRPLQLPEPAPAEPDPRADYIAGLRMLADLLERHPELTPPYTGADANSALLVIPISGQQQREQIAAWARALPGRKAKTTRESPSRGYLDLNGNLRGIHIQVIADRAEVCDRIVVGTREVTEEVPDPEALAAVPAVTVTKVVEEVRWECRPVLAEPAEVAAAALTPDAPGLPYGGE